MIEKQGCVILKGESLALMFLVTAELNNCSVNTFVYFEVGFDVRSQRMAAEWGSVHTGAAGQTALSLLWDVSLYYLHIMLPL